MILHQSKDVQSFPSASRLLDPKWTRQTPEWLQDKLANEKTEHAAWKKAKPRLTATANEIAIFEFVLFYLNPMLDVKERKLVWARSIKIPWHYIGSHILKCSRHTAKKRYMEIIRLLRMRILISDELIKKLPRL